MHSPVNKHSMEQQILELQALLQKEQRRREDAERGQQEAERAKQEAENQTRKTTLLEFLDGCHTKVYWHLNVQHNRTLSTQGSPANADNKLRPDCIRPWESFARDQEEIWITLMESSFPEERQFTSLQFLEESGESIKRRMLSSEMDLHHFLRSTVEDPVTLIVQKLHDDPYLRRQFDLHGSVSFENHANTLSVDTIQERMQEICLEGHGRRRSPRLQAQNERASASQPRSDRAPMRFSPPRADQFCVYNTTSNGSEQGERVPAYISELKAPHKLPLGYIQEGLGEINLDDIVTIRVKESIKRQCQHLLAAVITQAYSYMVQAGLEYGCIHTGEAIIFLRVPEDPRTVYYYLSVPNGDVGKTTGWSSDLKIDNRLHLTAVGQMLAFTLRAMRTRPRTSSWRTRAVDQLNVWAVEYEQVLDHLNIKEAPSSEYRPSPNNHYTRISPIKLRPRARRAIPAACAPEEERRFTHGGDDDGDDNDDFDNRDDYNNGGDFDANTPSRSRRAPLTNPTTTNSTNNRHAKDSGRGRNMKRYCTQECLFGLRNGGLLDGNCPNMQYHGKLRHTLNRKSFLKLIKAQLAKDLDEGCEPVGRPGSRGVLFRVTLLSHGYVLAAKGTPLWFSHLLRHEAEVYGRLSPIQGKHVPIHLGNITLDVGYPFEGIAIITDMMLLSFAGQPISRVQTDRTLLKRKVEESIQAVHQYGVLQRDAEARNILWNGGHVMIIDFERAIVMKPRKVLGELSWNGKRKTGGIDDAEKSGPSQDVLWLREVQQALRAAEIK
ncbi:hypothetical protein GQ43DRAFT_12038 [Delitschia confertaspora ATCC 74209]|uniref:Protein kinase domain-containing protein n=1 Tax=Delitschia confertaspora ATCC 74209 TaxID=1513339 RepID=A0A9P4MQN7_9PLEO|nr:hypothetical protein GQ43DRAFT_12038 [Delitschia confertaspora ATCC 74209]